MSVILLLNENGEDITNEQLYCVEPDCLGEPWCTAWGICSENKAKNLEIHQEEPTTSENIPARLSLYWKSNGLNYVLVGGAVRGSDYENHSQFIFMRNNISIFPI